MAQEPHARRNFVKQISKNMRVVRRMASGADYLESKE